MVVKRRTPDRRVRLVSGTRSEDAGTALDSTLAGGRLELMQQRLRVGGRDITLVVPRDVDAVMQMYIDAGELRRGGAWLSVEPVFVWRSGGHSQEMEIPGQLSCSTPF